MKLEKLKELVEEKVKKIYMMRNSYFSSDKKSFDFTAFYDDSLCEFNGVFLEVMAECLGELDEIYNKRRDPSYHQITHRSKSKPILTKEGVLELKRNRYMDMDTKEPFYYLDDLLGLKKRQKISDTFQADILKASVEGSYNSVKKKYKGMISTTTAINIAKRNKKGMKTLNKRSEYLKTVRKLYIEADEDHISLRGGKNKIVKLAYVHEGYTLNEKTKKRELKNARYFSTTGDIWCQIKKYIKENYLPGVAVSLNGDGALWIKGGIKEFPIVTFHLDKFHTYQAIRRISGRNHRKAAEIIESLKKRDSTFLEYLYWKRFSRFAKSDPSSGRMTGLLYLINNIDYINLDNKNICCSVEGHVSHILSARMSSRPMAWSEEGADIMARYRAFLYNKGDFRKVIQESAF